MLFSALALLLAFSAALGYGVVRALGSRRLRWTQLVLPLASAVLFLAAGTVTFGVLGLNYAADDPIGSRERVLVRVDRPAPASVAAPPTSSPSSGGRVPAPPERAAVGELWVIAPSSVAPHQDFVLQVITTSTHGFASGVYPVRVLAPPSAQLRTFDTCDEVPAAAGSIACGTSNGRRFEVSWDITPTESGEMLFTLALPSEVMPHTELGEWEATIPVSYGRGPTARSDGPVQSVVHEGFSLNLRNNQVRIPVSVVTTLGVTRTTYNVVAVFGTVLSAALGSGWLWRVLELWRVRRRSRPSTADAR